MEKDDICIYTFQQSTIIYLPYDYSSLFWGEMALKSRLSSCCTNSLCLNSLGLWWNFSSSPVRALSLPEKYNWSWFTRHWASKAFWKQNKAFSDSFLVKNLVKNLVPLFTSFMLSLYIFNSYMHDKIVTLWMLLPLQTLLFTYFYKTIIIFTMSHTVGTQQNKMPVFNFKTSNEELKWDSPERLCYTLHAWAQCLFLPSGQDNGPSSYILGHLPCMPVGHSTVITKNAGEVIVGVASSSGIIHSFYMQNPFLLYKTIICSSYSPKFILTNSWLKKWESKDRHKSVVIWCSVCVAH